MERKIGETFEFEGKTLQVKATNGDGCEGCIFNVKCTRGIKSVTGFCRSGYRDDKKDVIFVEVKDEQPQELNLCEILKYCPEGEPLWSPLLGDVKLSEVNQLTNAVFVKATNLTTWRINHDATITINGGSSKEIMLYPSREQRDWAKVKYEPKKEKFDPKTLNAFDRILFKNSSIDIWACSLFSHHIKKDEAFPFFTCTGYAIKYCIPYNDDTKHLVGTSQEAPEYYRYWED